MDEGRHSNSLEKHSRARALEANDKASENLTSETFKLSRLEIRTVVGLEYNNTLRRKKQPNYDKRFEWAKADNLPKTSGCL